MSKMKTHSSTKKRFKITAKGRVKAKSAFTSHMMMNKPKSMKRKARGLSVISEEDQRIVLRNFLPYSRRLRKSKAYTSKIAAGEK